MEVTLLVRASLPGKGDDCIIFERDMELEFLPRVQDELLIFDEEEGWCEGGWCCELAVVERVCYSLNTKYLTVWTRASALHNFGEAE